jgi:hypothetical protein
MFLVQNAWVSHFLFTKILELTLSCVSQATQYSPSLESPEDLKLVKNKVDCRLSYDSFLTHALLLGDSAALPRYEYFAAGSSTFVE